VFGKQYTAGQPKREIPGIERLAEAIKRGKACNTDLLKLDFFTVAGNPIEELRQSYAIPPKSSYVLQLDRRGAAPVQ